MDRQTHRRVNEYSLFLCRNYWVYVNRREEKITKQSLLLTSCILLASILGFWGNTHYHPHIVTLPLSPSHCHSPTVTLTLSHCHPPTVTLPLSHSHCHTHTVTLPLSHYIISSPQGTLEVFEDSCQQVIWIHAWWVGRHQQELGVVSSLIQVDCPLQKHMTECRTWHVTPLSR